MAEEKEITGSEVVGGMVGAVVGNVKGSSVGLTACMAALPVLGPFALLLVPAGAIIGTLAGASVGSRGLGAAVMLTLGAAGTELDGSEHS